MSRGGPRKGAGKPKGLPKSGGRVKGSMPLNKRLAMEKAEALGIDAFEVLLYITAGDWKALGYHSATFTKTTKDGLTYEEEHITLDHRLNAAKDVTKYCYPQLKAIDHSGKIDTSLAERLALAKMRIKDE